MNVISDPAQFSPLDRSVGSFADRHEAASNELSEWVGRLQEYIAGWEPRISALASMKLDFTDKEQSGKDLPLKSLVIGVKDIIHVDGFDTRAGSLLPYHLWQGREAKLVSSLRQLGGLPIAKTATTEFAYLEPAPTRNPWHPTYTPGGSSSGSAAGVAAGYFDIGIGTQTVGSVIRPASFCGVCGFKPTVGLVPKDGVLTFSRTADQLGFFARQWETLIYTFEHLKVLADEYGNNFRNLRLGMVSGEYLKQASPSIISQVNRFASRLEEAGWEVSEMELPLESIFDLNNRHQDLISHEFFLAHAKWFAEYAFLYRPGTVSLFEKGATISEARYIECLRSCLNWRQQLIDFLDSNSVDILICPSAVGTATPGLVSTGNPIMNLPWTHAGLPVTSIPLGLIQNEKKDWLPVGAQLIASFKRDGFLLKASKVISQRLDLSAQQKLEG